MLASGWSPSASTRIDSAHLAASTRLILPLNLGELCRQPQQGRHVGAASRRGRLATHLPNEGGMVNEPILGRVMLGFERPAESPRRVCCQPMLPTADWLRCPGWPLVPLPLAATCSVRCPPCARVIVSTGHYYVRRPRHSSCSPPCPPEQRLFGAQDLHCAGRLLGQVDERARVRDEARPHQLPHLQPNRRIRARAALSSR
jgi:hypothetical protein